MRRHFPALVVAALALGCRSPRPAAKPNILLISIDTLRPDHLGCYGYARATSPHIDALARSGATFDRAFTPSTWTLPAHASMLTGLSPFRHGAVTADKAIHADVATLPERLKAAGYATAGVISGPFVSRRFGFERGFDRFVERFHPIELRALDRYQPVVLDTVAAARPPFFLFVHYFSVHSPYAPPAEFNRFVHDPPREAAIEGRDFRLLHHDLAAGSARVSPAERDRLVDLYDGEILAVDASVDELVRAVRARAPDTLVVVTADHGEEFLEHDNVLHGYTLFEEVLRVPLIVAGPGVTAGVRVNELVSLVDVTPTVLEAAGIAPGRLDGLSLWPLLRGGHGGGHERLPLHSRSGDAPGYRVNLRGVRTADSKLVVDLARGRHDFYDLRVDPGEKHPLADAPGLPALERYLDEFIERPAAAAPEPDASQVEALKSLGYQ